MQRSASGGADAWGAWSAWAAGRDPATRRRVRVTVQRLPPDLGALALYTPDHIRHIIRLEAALGRWPPTAAPGAWRRPDLEPWRVPDLIQHIRLEHPSDLSPGILRGVDDIDRIPPHAAGGGGWVGWAAGALLLGAVLLVVRALERCLHKKLFKERRTSEEWPWPNVHATNRLHGSAPRLDDSDPENRGSGNDLPPPYSECANHEDGSSAEDKPIEEPPPPYSACYFSNPKNGMPTVHFYNRRRHTQQGATNEATDLDVASGSALQVNSAHSNVRHINQSCEVTLSVDTNSDIQNTNETSEVRSERVDADKPERIVAV